MSSRKMSFVSVMRLPMLLACAIVLFTLCLAPLPALADDSSDAGSSSLRAATVLTTQSGDSNRYIDDGTYIIDIDKERKLVVDVTSSKSGAKSMMKPDTAKKSQQWEFEWDEAYDAYRIKNASSGFYLTAKSAKSTKENVWQVKYSKSNKLQLWKLERVGSGYKILSRANSSLGLGTWSTKTKSGYYVTTQKGKSNKFKFLILPVTKSLMKPGTEAPDSLDGVYARLALTSKTSKKLGVAGDSGESGASVNINKKTNSQSQKWYFKLVNAEEGSYMVVNVGSGEALSVASNGRHVDTNAVQSKADESKKTVQWWVRKTSSGSYTFTSCYNGLMLRATGTKDEANVNLGQPGYCSNNAFKIEVVDPIESGFYQVAAKSDTSLSLSVPDGSSKINKQLVLKTYDSQLWQKYELVKDSSGKYALRSVTSGRYLGESSGKVVQGPRSIGESQLWDVVWEGSGFALKNSASGKYLSVSGLVKNGKNIMTSSTFKQATCLFVFKRRHLIDDGAYFICDASSSTKVMALSENDVNKEKAKAGVYKKTNGQSQKFNIAYLGKDSKGNEIYKIANAVSNKVLNASGKTVNQTKASKAKNHRWAAFVPETGMVAFTNVNTSKTITRNSSKVSLAKYNSSSPNNVRWSLEPTVAFNKIQLKGYKKIAATYSKTNYSIAVDLTNHRVMVFARESKSSPWKLKFYWICSNGASLTPTPAVNVLTSGYKRYENPTYRPDGTIFGSSFYYMTFFTSGKYFHTPLYKKGSKTKYADARMGRSISHGCIRVQTPNAIWIYKNIKKGTRVITYY